MLYKLSLLLERVKTGSALSVMWLKKFNHVLTDILKRETPKIVGSLTSLMLSSLTQLVLCRAVFMLWQKPIITHTHPTEEESNQARSREIIQF